jgi:hypothetical protein
VVFGLDDAVGGGAFAGDVAVRNEMLVRCNGEGLVVGHGEGAGEVGGPAYRSTRSPRSFSMALTVAFAWLSEGV